MEHLNLFAGKRVVIVSDAWEPQINGVVRTLQMTITHMQQRGIDVCVIHPLMFDTFALPFYPEIQIPYAFKRKLDRMLDTLEPDYIHISVEGPLGFAVRNWCKEHNVKFTTAYHTKFPEYVKRHYGIPTFVTYGIMRRFHNDSSAVMSVSSSIDRLLVDNGIIAPIKRWTRGVDHTTFTPQLRERVHTPYAVYVGRVSAEKNIEAFLSADAGDLRKVVVGSGPQQDSLSKKFPTADFVGPKSGRELARYYASAEVFVFPSKTDTFGLVNIESLACGTPVAAYPVDGPMDIVVPGVGCLNEDLSTAIDLARQSSREKCVEHALTNFTWEVATTQFLTNLVPAK